MDQKHIGSLAAILSMFGLVLHYIPVWIIEQWTGGGSRFPEIVPTFGTEGSTKLIYTQWIDTLDPSIIVFLAIALGYYTGQRICVQQEYRQFLKVATLGSMLPIFIGIGLAMFGGIVSTSISIEGFLISIGFFFSSVAAVPLIVVLGGFAGLSFTYFEQVKNSSRLPPETDSSATPKQDQESGLDTGNPIE